MEHFEAQTVKRKKKSLAYTIYNVIQQGSDWSNIVSEAMRSVKVLQRTLLLLC